LSPTDTLRRHLAEFAQVNGETIAVTTRWRAVAAGPVARSGGRNVFMVTDASR
jgi:hypothetical protein